MLKNKLQKLVLIMCSVMIASCGSGNQSNLVFKDSHVPVTNAVKIEAPSYEKRKAELMLEKNRVWEEINLEAKTSFEDVKEIFTNKCMNCHDSNFKLPLYGRIFENINPVHKHQVDGLKAFDFSNGFPFTVPGNPPQISILKSIRNSVVKRTMPIKSFTAVYPKKKINEEDEKAILTWIDTTIQKFDEFEVRYNTPDANVEVQAKHILEMKCFRCHANGNAKGGFGGMENTEGLINSKYVSKNNPEQSKIFTTVRDGQMPPNKMDSLSGDEQYIIRDWLEQIKTK